MKTGFTVYNLLLIFLTFAGKKKCSLLFADLGRFFSLADRYRH